MYVTLQAEDGNHTTWSKTIGPFPDRKSAVAWSRGFRAFIKKKTSIIRASAILKELRPSDDTKIIRVQSVWIIAHYIQIDMSRVNDEQASFYACHD